MPASTPAPWLMPYPVGTDRVADGDNAMQSIAERVALIANALPRGLIGSGSYGGVSFPVNGSGNPVVTLPSVTFAESRDLLLVMGGQHRNAAAAGSGISFTFQMDNVPILNPYVAMAPVSTFDSSFATSVPYTAVAGAHVFKVTCDAYGANGNTTWRNYFAVIDLGATGAI